ncbi:MAG: hypothetical protein KF729_37405 [Sandaracinaceae bacterium]|nr:hypothetical protein [Sandaracinaceae bacterium]
MQTTSSLADVWAAAPVPDPSAPPRAPSPEPARATPSAPPASADDGAPRVRPSRARDLLDLGGGARAIAARAALGTGLAAVYGLALGAREGGLAFLTHAAGVPAALVAVALVGLPSLYVVLSIFDAPLSIERAAGAAARGIASGGLVLAGLAPLAALYVVTSESAHAAALTGTLGLALGGLLGLRHLVSTLREALEEADSATRLVATLVQLGFGLFAVLLGWRIWTALLPLVGGA